MSRGELYRATSPAQRAEWLSYFTQEPTLAELLDLHFANLCWLLATVNSTGKHTFDLESFRIMKEPKKLKTPAELAASLDNFARSLQAMAAQNQQKR